MQKKIKMERDFIAHIILPARNYLSSTFMGMKNRFIFKHGNLHEPEYRNVFLL